MGQLRALFPELFRGDRIRAKASAIQQGYQVVALLIGTALTPIIYDAMGFRVWRFCTRAVRRIYVPLHDERAGAGGVQRQRAAQARPSIPRNLAQQEVLGV